MYVTVQFIILEILLGLIFLVVLYFMVRELVKKIIRREIREIKEPLQVLANYLVEQSESGPDDPDGPGNLENPGNPRNPGNTGNHGNPGGSQAPRPGGTRNLPASCPEKLPEELVDVADEFVQLKNTNRISAYNIRVQKIWDLYKQNKITLRQYKDELLRLKKEFGIATQEDEDSSLEKQPLNASEPVRLHPLTPTPSAAPDPKVKNIDTEPQPTAPDEDEQPEQQPDRQPNQQPDQQPDQKRAGKDK